MSSRYNIITVAHLRPTQMSVGRLLVKHKRAQLRLLEKRPAELMDFILEHPIRVVLGPKDKAFVIDHHHLALALLKEKFETAPMDVEDDFSALPKEAFWKRMQSNRFVHAYDGEGNKKTLADIPKSLHLLEDDPYRSLAGFIREAGGFRKVETPYAEFLWADYYRTRIKNKRMLKHFTKALDEAMALAHHRSAEHLPGFLTRPVK